MTRFYNLAAEADRELLKLPVPGYVQVKPASSLEKMDICSFIGVGTDTGWKSSWNLHFDRLLLRNLNAKYNRFLVSGSAWTFSPQCPAPSVWTRRGMTHHDRGPVTEAEGASDLPYASIKHLSVHCDISPLVLGSPSEVRTVPPFWFSKLPKEPQAAIPFWSVGHMTSLGPVRGGGAVVQGACAATTSWWKPWLRYSMAKCPSWLAKFTLPLSFPFARYGWYRTSGGWCRWFRPPPRPPGW